MYYRNDDVRVEEVPKPEISPREILVKGKICGICGSDVLEWYRIRKAPLVLGHEMVGEIAEVGSEVRSFRPGQRVFVSHHIPCNTCVYCLRGHYTACETLHSTNFIPGGFSEYIRVPELNVDRGVFPLPPEVGYEEGSFIEPLACVVRAQRLADVRPGQSVVVIGSGIAGLLHILLAKALGAGRIIATDVNPSRLQAALRLGAEAVVQADPATVPRSQKEPRNSAADPTARSIEANGGRTAELVVACAGALSAFQQAMELVDRGGTVLCFATANPGQDLHVPINDFCRNEITLMPSYGKAPLVAVAARALIRSKRVPVAELVSHRIPLSRIQEGFAMTASGRDAHGNPSLKVLVDLER